MPSSRLNSTHPIGKPWMARVQVNGKRIYLGFFSNWSEAREAENEYRKSRNLKDMIVRSRNDYLL